jgi:hypothetical protein
MTSHPDHESAVRAVHFDRATHTLRIEFANGDAFDYADVPEHVYDALARSHSPSAYFTAHVLEEYIGVPAGTIDLADLANERREDAVLGAPLAEPLSGAADLPSSEREQVEDTGVRASRHTWVVDVLDDDAAAIEVDGRRITPIPRWLLPGDARDGDVLRVTHARSATRSTFSIEVDHDATRLAYQRSADQLKTAPPSGTGDVNLSA